jgi:hypothetical protein
MLDMQTSWPEHFCTCKVFVKLNKDHETMFILFYLKAKFIPLPIMAFSRSSRILITDILFFFLELIVGTYTFTTFDISILSMLR